MAVHYYIGMQEQEIIEGCKRKERKCQEALFRKYHRMIYGVCLRYASDDMEAEDMMQETMIHIIRKIDLYHATGSFEGWIRSLSVRMAIQLSRKNKRLVFVEEFDEQQEPAFDDYALEKISADEIRKVINMLPDGYKIVFNLHAIEGYTHQEIGELLGIATGTSKSQYARAKIYLYNLLQQFLDIHKEKNHAGI